MIEWLLSDAIYPIIMTLLCIILVSPFIVLIVYTNITRKYELRPLALSITIVSTILLGIPIFYIGDSIKFEYVSDEQWKQIYTNNIEAKVKIDITNYNLSLKNKDTLVAGEYIELDQYDALKSSKNNKIIVEKNGASYSKKVLIDKNDIISNSDVNSNSKIIKIEYKNIQGHQRTLFGYKSPIEKNAIIDNIDGKIRITIEKDSTEKELKQLFENNE